MLPLGFTVLLPLGLAVFFVGVHGKVTPWVIGYVSLGITDVVSLGSSIFVPGKIFFWDSCGSMFTIIA